MRLFIHDPIQNRALFQQNPLTKENHIKVLNHYAY